MKVIVVCIDALARLIPAEEFQIKTISEPRVPIFAWEMQGKRVAQWKEEQAGRGRRRKK